MNLRQAQNICTELEAERFRLTRGDQVSVKWNDVYSSEEALVEAIKGVAIPSNMVAPNCTFKGYGYIFSFAKRLQDGKELTEAQLRQAKRLAFEIKKANAISEYMREV